jgi:hypothetical protein
MEDSQRTTRTGWSDMRFMMQATETTPKKGTKWNSRIDESK